MRVRLLVVAGLLFAPVARAQTSPPPAAPAPPMPPAPPTAPPPGPASPFQDEPTPSQGPPATPPPGPDQPYAPPPGAPTPDAPPPGAPPQMVPWVPPPGCPACPCDCRVPAGALPPGAPPAPPPPGGQGPGSAGPQFHRGGLMAGAGLGVAVMTDGRLNQGEGASAAGLGIAARVGYAFGRSGGFVLMLDHVSGYAGVVGGGTYSMGATGLLGQYFVRDDWALSAGIGGGNISSTPNDPTRASRKESGSALTIGAAHDIYRTASSNSLTVEARLCFLGTQPPAAQEPDAKNVSSTLLQVGALWQWW